MFSKGRIWEDERRNRRRSEEPNAKETCDAFAMSDVDLRSPRMSRNASSLATPSQHISTAASTGSGAHEEEDGGKSMEMEIVVIPKYVAKMSGM